MDAEFHAIRVLIVSENATDQFGGESILPLHYFRFLRQENIATWLITHERVKERLTELLGDDIQHVIFIPETKLFSKLHNWGLKLPPRVRAISTHFLMQCLTQYYQWKLAKKAVKAHHINIVHEPAPVSPKRPSALFGLGCPVIIGPMNGGMDFPQGFSHMKTLSEKIFYFPLRMVSHIVNIVIPGKLFANLLLVANHRTKKALPFFKFGRIEALVENGVDLSLWTAPDEAERHTQHKIHFVYVGRLVDWKCVDILIEALIHLRKEINCKLFIVGGGDEKEKLIKAADHLVKQQVIKFLGWLTHEEIRKLLAETDVLVLPSVRECGGAVILEAMAMKKPVIAVNWGGPADYITPATGILLNPANRQQLLSELITAMEKMAQDNTFRKQCGDAGYQRAVEIFSWQAKIKQVIDIYQQVILDKHAK
ncbi:glycosyltransferase family 4 protein [Methylophaga pinxianii]|uniref:glycosyltransferase family 4 protein n=1 Tax=Methylophaga pinxianii TaxID=2881052 RepID=UPI001CF28FCF|nr:glycosyltransferase family 4 protein [Methylophaga pinxianii]MCB2426640.1 glycosyltransferase family 4 protein [Methylophaga pinxianii]UPH45100.1 glycosyltransferase family 4 protein [Methylophaga pinxianii]